MDEQKENNNKKKSVWYKDIIGYLIIIVIVILIRTFIFTPAVVDGPSMEPTLKTKEWLVVLKFTKINKNDVIVFKYNKKHLVKRVIGLPGDTMECIDGQIYINDKHFEDEFNIEDNSCTGKIILNDDEYFVLGDNREVSMDSRMIGPIKKDQILGTSNFRLFPIKKIGKFNKAKD